MNTGSIVLAVLGLALAVSAQERGARARGSSSAELKNLSYETRTFESKALGGKPASYGIFLPKDYADEKNAQTRYPLAIWLHGMFEDQDRFLQRGGAEVLDQMIGDGKVPPLVFVCADGDRSSFWTNAKTKDANYEDLVTKDLLTHLEATWRIAPERENHALMGVSMGGYGALKIAFKNPALFGIVAAHSSAVLPDDPEKLMEDFPWLRQRGGQLLASVFGEPMDVEKYHAENVLGLAKALDVEKLQGLKIYFDCGDKDRYGFHKTNAELHEVLDAQKIRHSWRLVEGGGHSWGAGFTQQALEHSLSFVAAQVAVGRASKGLGGALGGAAAEDDKDKSKEHQDGKHDKDDPR